LDPFSATIYSSNSPLAGIVFSSVPEALQVIEHFKTALTCAFEDT